MITDQQAVSFIFDHGSYGKTKNDKIDRWRIELSCFEFDIEYRPGKLNVTADCLSRAVCSAASNQKQTLLELHEGLVHPGVARMYAFIRSRNLPYSMEEVKVMTSQCKTCAEVKPRFIRPTNPPLIKALKPFDRLSVDFKGPVPSSTQNKYLLVIVDEFSRFPFVYPSKDTSSATVIKHLGNLFSVFGLPGYVHSDNGSGFISKDFISYLSSLGVPCSNSSSYNPRGNGQVERYNGIIWKGVQLAVHSKNLSISQWESVLPSVLHSVRTLLCTATNQTPHERFFSFQRRTVTGSSLPPWVHANGKALVKRHVRTSKYDPWVEECEIIHVTPSYAQIKTVNGKEQTVSLRDLAPLPCSSDTLETEVSNTDIERPNDPILRPNLETPVSLAPGKSPPNSPNHSPTIPTEREGGTYSEFVPVVPSSCNNPGPSSEVNPRRSSRNSKAVDRLNYDRLGGD